MDDFKSEEFLAAAGNSAARNPGGAGAKLPPGILDKARGTGMFAVVTS